MTWSDISEIFETLERRLISSLKRNLQRHRDWEKRDGFDWSAWQAEKLKNIEMYRKENRRIMDGYTGQIDAETRALMEEQFAEGYEHEERVLLDTGIPVNPSTKSFFGVNSRRMDSLTEDMLNAESRAESAALRMMDDTYRSVVAKTAAEMATGAVTLPQAIDIAMKDFLRAGINCIEYKNGRRVNIADYVQMALRTAATRSYLQGAAKKRIELGIDTVLVSQYGACSETCLPWQGRVYIDDVFGSFDGETDGERGKSKNGNWYPLLSVAVHNGLFHPNCRHTLSTWIEGVSALPKPLDKAAVRKASALEQKQRALERRVREAERTAAGKWEPDAQKQAKKQVQARQKELREFIEGHSDVLHRDYWREKIYPDNSNITADTIVTEPEKSAKLTDDDIYALYNYKSAKSYPLNYKLRENIPLDDSDIEFIKSLDAALEKLPVYKGTVYRSLSTGDLDDADAFKMQHEVGKVVEYAAYTSAGVDVYDDTMDIRLVITSKTGHDMREYNPEESEIVFKRKSRFRVIKIEGGKIYMEEET